MNAPKNASQENPYIPIEAKVISTREESATVKTLRLQIIDEKKRASFSFLPGQFIQVTALGVGEAPISISSSPLNAQDFFEVSVKKLGNVTRNLHLLKEGDCVGVRGPLGNHYPLSELEGKNLAFVAGGIGLAPLKSAVHHVLAHRSRFGNISLYYGAKTPAEIVFSKELAGWQKEGVSVQLTVDKVEAEGKNKWHHFTGTVPALLQHFPLNPKNTAVISCGPPVMINYAVDALSKQGFSGDDIYLSLERNMCCGIGKCGHCMARGKYVCTDGPVFTWNQAKELEE